MKPSPNSRFQNFTQGVLLAGALLILLGIVAIVVAIIRPGLIGVLLSGLFLVAGAIRLVYSWQTRAEKGLWLKVSIGILYLLASLILLTAILQRYFSLSTLLGGILLLQGILELNLARQLRPNPAGRWFLATGLGALLLGGLFVSSLEVGIALILGLIAALSLILPGGWLIFIALNMQSK